MNRHDADGVVIGFVEHGLVGFGAVVPLKPGPGQVVAQVSATRLSERSSLVDDIANPAPGIACPSAMSGQRHGVAVIDQAKEELARFVPPAPRRK